MAGQVRRMTKQRRVILDELDRLKVHPTADELYERVRRRLPRISLGTVYRNLQTLARDGEIRALRDGDRMRFDSSLHDHFHVRCLACGKVADVPGHAARGLRDEVAGSGGFEIIAFKVDFVGLCPECKQQGKEAVLEGDLSDFKMLGGSLRAACRTNGSRKSPCRLALKGK